MSKLALLAVDRRDVDDAAKARFNIFLDYGEADAQEARLEEIRVALGKVNKPYCTGAPAKLVRFIPASHANRCLLGQVQHRKQFRLGARLFSDTRRKRLPIQIGRALQ